MPYENIKSLRAWNVRVPFMVAGCGVSGDLHPVSIASSGTKPPSHSHDNPNCLV